VGDPAARPARLGDHREERARLGTSTALTGPGRPAGQPASLAGLVETLRWAGALSLPCQEASRRSAWSEEGPRGGRWEQVPARSGSLQRRRIADSLRTSRNPGARRSPGHALRMRREHRESCRSREPIEQSSGPSPTMRVEEAIMAITYEDALAKLHEWT